MTSATTSSSSSSIAKEQSIPNSSSSSSSSPPSEESSIDIDTITIPKKPQRPLTAYHIFLHIEREYIIQTMDGDVADQSTMDNKILHDDVPQRYKNIKLMPDWYAGPGKRTKKRKHRKQHGKIGFLELSKTISARWAQLEQVDPETKSFVQKIAKSEVAEYFKVMNEYKELVKDFPPSLLPPKKEKKKKTKKKRTTTEEEQQQQQQNKKMKTFHLQEESSIPLSTSTDNESTVTSKKKKFVRRVTIEDSDSDRSITEAFDSFKNDQPLKFDDIFCQPVGSQQPIGVEVMMGMNMMDEDCCPLEHSISSGSLSSSCSYPEICGSEHLLLPVDQSLNSPSLVEEVEMCDDEILQLWASSI